jgi:hypothetical protein
MDTTQFRNEITGRVVVLHNQLTVAAVMALVVLLAFLWLEDTGKETWLLLGSAPIFAALTFNYQSNQITMEAMAKYLMTTEYQDKEWERYWENYKLGIRFSSVMKTMALILPQIVILIWLSFFVNLTQPQVLLVVFDWLLGVLVLLNFRYKLPTRA